MLNKLINFVVKMIKLKENAQNIPEESNKLRINEESSANNTKSVEKELLSEPVTIVKPEPRRPIKTINPPSVIRPSRFTQNNSLTVPSTGTQPGSNIKISPNRTTSQLPDKNTNKSPRTMLSPNIVRERSPIGQRQSVLRNNKSPIGSRQSSPSNLRQKSPAVSSTTNVHKSPAVARDSSPVTRSMKTSTSSSVINGIKKSYSSTPKSSVLTRSQEKRKHSEEKDEVLQKKVKTDTGKIYSCLLFIYVCFNLRPK